MASNLDETRPTLTWTTRVLTTLQLRVRPYLLPERASNFLLRLLGGGHPLFVYRPPSRPAAAAGIGRLAVWKEALLFPFPGGVGAAHPSAELLQRIHRSRFVIVGGPGSWFEEERCV